MCVCMYVYMYEPTARVLLYCSTTGNCDPESVRHGWKERKGGMVSIYYGRFGSHLFFDPPLCCCHYGVHTYWTVLYVLRYLKILSPAWRRRDGWVFRVATPLRSTTFSVCTAQYIVLCTELVRSMYIQIRTYIYRRWTTAVEGSSRARAREWAGV